MSDSRHAHLPKPVEFLLDWGILIGAVVAFIWANTAAETYHEVEHALHFGVNEVLMVVFFAAAGSEIRRAFAPGGAFSSFKTAALPALATIGGVAGPAIVYTLITKISGGGIEGGWPAATPTDIAFSLILARLIGLGPVGTVFLLSLAILDDAIGLVFIATLFSSVSNFDTFLASVIVALALTQLLNRVDGVKWWYYLLPAAVSWYGFHTAGIHTTLSALPIIFTMNGGAMHAFEHVSKRPVQVILFLFGLTNAGVPLGATGPATYAVLLGLLVGKPIGIAIMAKVGLMVGLKLPAGVSFNEVIKIGTVASVGFTVALFISGLAFGEDTVQGAAKIGALLSLPCAAIMCVVVRWIDHRWPELFNRWG